MEHKKIRPKLLIICIAIPLAVGGLSALLSADGMEYFRQSVVKPPLNPPAWLFPIVWTILYVLMGIASYLVITSKEKQSSVDAALRVYGIQLLFNFAWSLIFFNLQNYLLAFVWLLLLLGLIIANAVLFGRIRPISGWLLVPYALWVSFAGYLNLAICLLN